MVRVRAWSQREAARKMADSDPTLHGYQIKRLKQAVAELAGQCPGLSVSLDWTGENETTKAGRMPTVQYKVSIEGRAAMSHPLGITAVPAALAASLRRRLRRKNKEIDSLIRKIERCSVM
jgi:hypothetical protein